jgi:hypothetical protein
MPSRPMWVQIKPKRLAAANHHRLHSPSQCTTASEGAERVPPSPRLATTSMSAATHAFPNGSSGGRGKGGELGRRQVEPRCGAAPPHGGTGGAG